MHGCPITILITICRCSVCGQLCIRCLACTHAMNMPSPIACLVYLQLDCVLVRMVGHANFLHAALTHAGLSLLRPKVFTLRKRLESYMRQLVSSARSISAVNASYYAARFRRAMRKVFI